MKIYIVDKVMLVIHFEKFFTEKSDDKYEDHSSEVHEHLEQESHARSTHLEARLEAL